MIGVIQLRFRAVKPLTTHFIHLFFRQVQSNTKSIIIEWKPELSHNLRIMYIWQTEQTLYKKDTDWWIWYTIKTQNTLLCKETKGGEKKHTIHTEENPKKVSRDIAKEHWTLLICYWFNWKCFFFYSKYMQTIVVTAIWVLQPVKTVRSFFFFFTILFRLKVEKQLNCFKKIIWTQFILYLKLKEKTLTKTI